ncbi:MAG: SEC-C domain-containing protein, partial [Anaerolineae bacterium]|nr:SEC-C domain-containing protein [Anaerolineae bacterium]
GPAQVEQDLSRALREAFGTADGWADEHWPAVWDEMKQAYRPERLDAAADAALEAYEGAFAEWVVGQILRIWKAQGGPEITSNEAALAQRFLPRLQEARERLATLELEEFFRWLVLTRMDREWVQYLEAIDDLQQGIGLQAYAQRDPKVEFRRQAFEMFDRLREAVQGEIVRWFFVELPNYHAFIQRQREMLRTRGELASRDYRMVMTGKGRAKQGAAATPGTSVTLVRDVKLGRNDPCWCGSGKKYKLCHMRSDQAKQS